MQTNRFLRGLNSLWPYAVLCTILIALFYGTGFNQNWAHWIDQELTLSYNGLLVYERYPQEYLDHPGFFSIHLISYLIGIANFLGFYHLQSIDDLNSSSSILGSLRDLIVTARHVALITSIAYVLVAYYIANKITHERVLSLLVAMFIFVSNGVFFHFTLTRTEPIAFLFLLGSLYFYIQYFKDQGRYSLLLLLSMLMLFCGALNKAQILVLAPFYFTWAYFFISEHKLIAPINNQPLIKVASFTTFTALAIFYSLISSGLSLMINLGLISFFFGLTFICAKKSGINPFKATSLLNIFYLMAFTALSYFSFKLNQNVSIFSNIEDPISMTRWLAPDPNAEKIAMDTNAIYVLSKIGNSLLEPLIALFSKGSSTLILFVFCIAYILLNRRSITKKEIALGIYSFFAFYAISLINRTRYVDAPHYLLLSEFFILTFSLVLINQIKLTRTKIKTVACLIFLFLFVNLVPYTKYYNLLIRKGGPGFCSSVQIFLEKIDAQKIAAECKGNPI